MQRHTKQLFINISNLVRGDDRTGVPRVARGLLSSLLETPPDGYRVHLVYATMEQQGFFYATDYMKQYFGHSDYPEEQTPVLFQSGDFFLGGIDFCLDVEIFQQETLRNMHTTGVKIYFIIHDLIPIFLSQHCFDFVTKDFTNWLQLCIEFDGTMCVSHATETDLQRWMKANAPLRLGHFHTGWFHHGCDIESSLPTLGIPEEGLATLEKIQKHPTILMVGTVESRKGYRQTLAAFEELWARGVEVNLAIVGKDGWLVDDLLERIKTHPELGHRLFRLKGISDEYLTRVYEASAAVLMASEGEGFGLPIIEGARYKKPLILRDLPVFQEVAGAHAFYFRGLEPSQLAQAIIQWLELYRKGIAPSSEGIQPLSWKESAAQLIRQLPL